eukprot:scaffold37689_cov49-Attheya_sp.AAC.4
MESSYRRKWAVVVGTVGTNDRIASGANKRDPNTSTGIPWCEDGLFRSVLVVRHDDDPSSQWNGYRQRRVRDSWGHSAHPANNPPPHRHYSHSCCFDHYSNFCRRQSQWNRHLPSMLRHNFLHQVGHVGNGSAVVDFGGEIVAFGLESCATGKFGMSADAAALGPSLLAGCGTKGREGGVVLDAFQLSFSNSLLQFPGQELRVCNMANVPSSHFGRRLGHRRHSHGRARLLGPFKVISRPLSLRQNLRRLILHPKSILTTTLLMRQ